MSPGRASSALTTSRLFWPASALRTQVWTAAQPLPGILWPDFSIAHVTKLAHHGLPGPTPAEARYSSTLAPVLVPSSLTPAASSFLASSRADAPRPDPPPPAAVAAAASATGTVPGAATKLAGPAGGWTAMNCSESVFFGAASAASLAVTALKLIESLAFGLGAPMTSPGVAGCPGTAAAAAAGAPATAGTAAGAPAGAAAAGVAPEAATSAGGFQLGSISVLKPRWTWSWWPASVK